MGILINDSVTISPLGIAISGLVRTFKGSFTVRKMAGQIDVIADCYTYLSVDHYNTLGASPISSTGITLSLQSYPADPIAMLYDKIKEGLNSYTDI